MLIKKAYNNKSSPFLLLTLYMIDNINATNENTIDPYSATTNVKAKKIDKPRSYLPSKSAFIAQSLNGTYSVMKIDARIASHGIKPGLHLTS